MQNPPRDDLWLGLGITDSLAPITKRKKMAEEFREQLTVGVPTAADEAVAG